MCMCAGSRLLGTVTVAGSVPDFPLCLLLSPLPTPPLLQLCEYSEALEENWGKPPGNLNSNGQELLIYGQQFGNVFIGVQPTFGYEGDPMRLLFSR